MRAINHPFYLIGEMAVNELTNNIKKGEHEKPITAAIYSRVSSGSQVFGYSLDEQIRLARERCNIMGWKVRYIFREDGESAKTTDRPKFLAMMEKAKRRYFDVLVFWKLDRFCRSLLDVVNVEKQLKDYGVSLHSITEQIDTTTSVGRFNFRNIASAAELERDMIIERTRMGMRALAMANKWPNRLPPLGFNKGKDDRLIINNEEADLIRKIFKRYIKLKSMPQLAYKLNKKGIKTKRGGKWTASTIKKILDNEIYIGIYKVAHVETYIKDYKIVSKQLFMKAKELRMRSKKDMDSMPKNRKQAIVERVFNEYFSYLNDTDQAAY